MAIAESVGAESTPPSKSATLLMAVLLSKAIVGYEVRKVV
jgi:hypothetical protein